MIETATYECSICNEPSLEICVRCTKDACPNHRCGRCKACSDCCECEVPLTEPEPYMAAVASVQAEPIQAEPIQDEAGASHETVEAADLPMPPEASEEPDLNAPSSAALEEVAAEPAPGDGEKVSSAAELEESAAERTHDPAELEETAEPKHESAEHTVDSDSTRNS